MWKALDFQQKTHLAKERASQWSEMQKETRQDGDKARKHENSTTALLGTQEENQEG